MNSKFRNVIISPHCDDAFLAIGGIIERLEDTMILDIFGTCAWSVLDKTVSTEELTIINQNEERKATEFAGVSLKLYEYPEAFLRNYKKWNSKRLHKSDFIIAEGIRNTIAENIIGIKNVYFPMSIGGHVDHLLVYNQTISIFNELSTDSVSYYLYEELPYAWYGGLDDRLNELRKRYNLSPIIVDITNVYAKKEQILNLYKSQISEEDLDKIKQYSLSIKPGVNCERIWKILKK